MIGANLAERGTRIGAVGSALQSTDTRLSTVIDGMKAILTDGSWREFVTARGEHVVHDRFVDFVTMPMLRGLGVSVSLIRKVLEADAKESRDRTVLDLLDQALQNEHGGDRSKSNNVQLAPAGNTTDRALRRLRKETEAGNEEAAALRAEVLAGRMSAHAAMVKAGFRPRAVTVPVNRPESVAATLRRHMSTEDLARLVALLIDTTTAS